MDILAFSFNGIAPIVLMMLLGMLMRRVGVLDKTSAGAINRLCYLVLIPCKLFTQMAATDLSKAVNGTTLVVSFIGTLSVIALLCLLVPRFIRDGARRGEFIQGVFRGNTAILGIPLLTNLYGSEAAAVLAIPLPAMVITYNILAPIVLAYYSGGSKPDPRKLARQVVTNPFLISSVLGFLAALVRLPMPVFLSKTLDSVGSTGSTLALIGLGAVTEISDFRRSGVQALAATGLRLAVIPAVMLTIGVLCGLRDAQLGVMVCFFCTPSAVGSYVLAKNVTGDGELARQILISTTLLSILTMFVTLALLRGIGVM